MKGNRFQTIELGEEDLIVGHQLSELQRAVIQNIIAGYAHDYMNVPFTDERPHEAAIKQSFYKGAVEALEHLLHSDEDVRDSLQNTIANQEGNLS